MERTRNDLRRIDRVNDIADRYTRNIGRYQDRTMGEVRRNSAGRKNIGDILSRGSIPYPRSVYMGNSKG